MAKNYDQPGKMDALNGYQSLKIIKQHLKSTDTVLDFGCATGTIACFLAGHVREIYGIDISPRMIEIARQRALDRNVRNIKFSQSSLFDEGFRQNSFQMILAFSLLHLLPDIDKIIQRVYELLQPGGLFVSLTSCLGEKVLFPPLVFVGRKIGFLPFIKCFKIIELEELITAGNFQFIENKSIDNNPLEHFIMAKKV